MSQETEFQMPTPDPALRHLDFLVGDWTVTGTTIEGPMGGAAEITGWESYTWLEGGFFLVHRWESRFEVGGHPVVDGGYEFFDYDPQTQTYRTIFFNSLGPYDPDSSGYAGTFEGESLVVIGPARISRRLNADGTITVDSDVPAGEDVWLPFMTCTLTRK